MIVTQKIQITKRLNMHKSYNKLAIYSIHTLVICHITQATVNGSQINSINKHKIHLQIIHSVQISQVAEHWTPNDARLNKQTNPWNQPNLIKWQYHPNSTNEPNHLKRPKKTQYLYCDLKQTRLINQPDSATETKYKNMQHMGTTIQSKTNQDPLFIMPKQT